MCIRDSSNTVAGHISSGSGVSFRSINRIIGVTKAYLSRVGQSPLPTELEDTEAKTLRDKGGEYGTTTGRKRKTNWLNLDKLIRAAKLAEIHDLIINNFKEGYDANVGERGVKLSGGQIQRIGIARALYNESNIIILDEGTSNLDQATEAKVITNISESAHTKLFIAIAHRLKTTINSDQIILFHDGEIQDIGTYGELEERNAIFKKMINAYTITSKSKFSTQNVQISYHLHPALSYSLHPPLTGILGGVGMIHSGFG